MGHNGRRPCYAGGMGIFQSPRVRDIPPHKWAIQVPESLPEAHYQDGWMSQPSIGQVEEVLLQMGFEKATNQRSHHPREFKDGMPSSDPDEHAVWIHAAGAIARVSSKGDGRVRNMDLQMEVDAGVYGRNMMGVVSGCGGSGSCEPQLSGKGHYCKSWSWHSNVLDTLKNIIASAQAAGRPVPFTQWSANEIHVCGAFPLQALVKIDPDTFVGMAEKDIRAALREQTRSAIDEKYSKWPGLGELAHQEMIERSVHNEIPGAPFHERDWWKAENAMDYCRRAMKHARIRWPNAKTRAVTEHWLLTIGSADAASMTADDPRLVEPGPGGAHFATCLALELRRDDGWDKLMSLLDSMTDEQVRQWAQATDAQGNTPFGELVFSHVTENSIFLPSASEITDLFGVVAERIGAASCPVTIGNKKPWLVLEDAFVQVGKRDDASRWSAMRYIKNLPTLVELFEQLEVLGCRDVDLDVEAMEMIDRIRQADAKLGDQQKGIEDFLPPGILAQITHLMMDKTVAPTRAPENRQMGRL